MSLTTTGSGRFILFVAWGDQHIQTVESLVSAKGFPGYPVHLLTDKASKVSNNGLFQKITRIDFELNGLLRKTELFKALDDEDGTFLFLDTDTRILGNIDLGFEKAEQFGIAAAQAAHYSMDHVNDFKEIMKIENVPCLGQLQYNSGVLFFSLTDQTKAVFNLSYELAKKHQDRFAGDQTFLSLAMEMLSFNPYTLSTSYNHRAFGELISGEVRIWHSRHAIPQDVNKPQPSFLRKYDYGRMAPHFPNKQSNWTLFSLWLKKFFKN